MAKEAHMTSKSAAAMMAEVEREIAKNVYGTAELISTENGVRLFRQTDRLRVRKGVRGRWRTVERVREWTSTLPGARPSGARPGPLGAVAGSGASMLVNDTTVDDSDKTFAVPAGEEWEILTIWVEIVTTATAGNRNVQLRFLDASANEIGRLRNGALVAASTTRNHVFGPEFPREATFPTNTSENVNPLGGPSILPAGFSVRVFDGAAVDAAGDDLKVRIFGRIRSA
jgi:hypothetical protein